MPSDSRAFFAFGEHVHMPHEKVRVRAPPCGLKADSATATTHVFAQKGPARGRQGLCNNCTTDDVVQSMTANYSVWDSLNSRGSSP